MQSFSLDNIELTILIYIISPMLFIRVICRDRDRSSPMRMDSGAPLSTLPPISSSAHISSSGSRSTATAAFVAALKVNSNGQQSTQSSSTSTSSGSLGGAAAVIGPINTSGSGVVEWSKMFELTGVRFDKTQPGPGESVPTLGDQHLLKLEEVCQRIYFTYDWKLIYLLQCHFHR